MRALYWLLSCAVIACAPAPRAPGLAAGLAGSYELVALDGRSLPWRVGTATGDSSAVEDGMLLIRTDGSGVLVLRTRLVLQRAGATSGVRADSDSVHVTVRRGEAELHIFAPGMHRDMPVSLGDRPLAVTGGGIEFAVWIYDVQTDGRDRRLAFVRRGEP